MDRSLVGKDRIFSFVLGVSPFLVSRTGLEPVTKGLRVPCSTELS